MSPPITYEQKQQFALASIPSEDDVHAWYWKVCEALREDTTPEQINALKDLWHHARLGLGPRRRLASKKKTGKPSQAPEVYPLAIELFREWKDALGWNPGDPLFRGFAAELAQRCQRKGIDLGERRIEKIVSTKGFLFMLYVETR